MNGDPPGAGAGLPSSPARRDAGQAGPSSGGPARRRRQGVWHVVHLRCI